jgi:hypothetical protein
MIGWYTDASFGQVIINFGSSKSDLNLKYRLGLEHALAEADFLSNPDIILVQALTIFSLLVRRHDSPRFVWMMTGIVIRMAHYLGLQRDGTHFEHLSPFDIEMRRRVWWAVCNLDLRACEDQGTDLMITSDSFDTKIPLNINDADISPESSQMPAEREDVTDMSFTRINAGWCDITKKIMSHGVKNSSSGLQEQTRLLSEIYQSYENAYLQYTTESDNIACWVGVTIARLVMAKMTLIVYLPVLFSSPSAEFSAEVRTKLLVAAIEVAEYNHALNAETASRKWRWVFQTHTHWHAIVYLMIEVSRRPWSAIVERAWAALHSSWLIPAQASTEKNTRIWVPLRKLMAKALRHREIELDRLRADPQAVAKLDAEDQMIPLPSSSGLNNPGSSGGLFRERWRKLVAMSEATGNLNMDSSLDPTLFRASGEQVGQTLEDISIVEKPEQAFPRNPSGEMAPKQVTRPPHDHHQEWTNGASMGPGGFLWADSDPSVDVFSNFDIDSMEFSMDMDVDNEEDWYHWVESAKGMTWEFKA